MKNLPVICRYFTSLILVATVTMSWATTPEKKPLFERLGGKKGVQAIARAFVDALSTDQNLLKNPQLKKLAGGADKPQVKSRLANELCRASGGPCKSNPKPIIEYTGVKPDVGPAEWFFILQDANQAMDTCKVPQLERMELINLLVRAKKE